MQGEFAERCTQKQTDRQTGKQEYQGLSTKLL